ncbi:MAG: response regulator [Proteobacteria bacterium]|nr:response regulator [Pseudomonadota bacterium]
MQRTILLVDDEENITSALTRLLRRDGYNILRANSGKAGLELLEKNQVGVIISDQRMPEMTGTEFLTKVRALYPDTVRIVLSGYTELNSVTEAINRGAVYKFLTKPWEEELLRANVEEAFQRHEMKIENARLTHALQLANDELNNINLELEQRVELKTRETVRNLSVLRVSQEILEHLPVAVIGIGDDDSIAIANRSAQRLFSAGQTLMGELASSVIPADMLEWALSGTHDKDVGVKSCLLNGREVACWCRSMGEFSQSSGVLLVVSTGLPIERFADRHVTEEK